MREGESMKKKKRRKRGVFSVGSQAQKDKIIPAGAGLQGYGEAPLLLGAERRGEEAQVGFSEPALQLWIVVISFR